GHGRGCPGDLARAGGDRVPGGGRGDAASGSHTRERGRECARRTREETVGGGGRRQQSARLVGPPWSARPGCPGGAGRDAGGSPREELRWGVDGGGCELLPARWRRGTRGGGRGWGGRAAGWGGGGLSPGGGRPRAGGRPPRFTATPATASR